MTKGAVPGDNRSYTIGLLSQRGVTLPEIAELVLDIQKPYFPNLTLEECLHSINRVLEKREVQNAVITGLTLDILTEKNLIAEPLATMLQNDDALYGIDEILSLSIVNVYGSIGFTNFGYLDKLKPGVIGRLNNSTGRINTFLDDLVAALAAAAASRLAHGTEAKGSGGD